MTREEIEKELDRGNLETKVYPSGKYWKIRRNGKTKLWKTRPNEFSISIKAGIHTYGYITQDNMDSFRMIRCFVDMRG